MACAYQRRTPLAQLLLNDECRQPRKALGTHRSVSPTCPTPCGAAPALPSSHSRKSGPTGSPASRLHSPREGFGGGSTRASLMYVYYYGLAGLSSDLAVILVSRVISSRPRRISFVSLYKSHLSARDYSAARGQAWRTLRDTGTRLPSCGSTLIIDEAIERPCRHLQCDGKVPW